MTDILKTTPGQQNVKKNGMNGGHIMSEEECAFWLFVLLVVGIVVAKLVS